MKGLGILFEAQNLALVSILTSFNEANGVFEGAGLSNRRPYVGARTFE